MSARHSTPSLDIPALTKGFSTSTTSNRSTRSRGMKIDRSGQRCRVTPLSSMA
jgi:hypothetical protein